MNKNHHNKHFDVIIVGAGLVGLTLACALAKQDLSVAVVDKNTIEPAEIGQENFALRVSAINHASQRILHNLNIWEKIKDTLHVSPYEKMHVWDSMGKGEIKFDCTLLAKANLGYIIENNIMHNALLSELEQFSNCVFFPLMSPASLTKTKNAVELHFQDKLSLQAKLIVGADGSNSWLRNYVGIANYSWSYDHDALVTTVETEISHQKTAWQCFLPNGPLALLPLSSPQHCSIVWSSCPKEIQQLHALNPEEFTDKISFAFDYRLGRIKQIANKVTLPLFMQHAKEYTRPRIALIGDAAHTIHPLAGQGINLGFLDAASLAQVISHANEKNTDIGDLCVLRRYERWRKSENWFMILGMEFLKRLFQTESPFFVKSRSFGLNKVNEFALLKNQFIDHALGLKGKLPELVVADLLLE